MGAGVTWATTSWSLRSGGSLKSAEVALKFGNDRLEQDETSQVFVAAGSKINIKDKILIPVQMSLTNMGETVLTNVRLTLVYDKHAQFKIDNMNKYLESNGTLMPGDMEEVTNASGSDGRVYTNFNLTKLNIKGTKSISYGLQAYEVDSKSDTFAFGANQIALEVLVEADGVPRKHFHLNYDVLPADGCAGLDSMYKLLYAKLGYLEHARKSYTDYLVCADYRSLDTPDGRYWFPLGQIQASKAIVEARRGSTPSR